MGETRGSYDQEFKDGAVRIVQETGKPIARVARVVGVNAGTLGNWCAKDRAFRGDGQQPLDESERAELNRLRRENAELVMQLGAPPTSWGNVLKRSMALWVAEAVDW